MITSKPRHKAVNLEYTFPTLITNRPISFQYAIIVEVGD